MPDPPPRIRLLHGDEADVFDSHQLALRCAVRRAVSGPDALVDDACAFAWLQFLRCQPDRATVFGWLRTVAIREAWKLARRERSDAHLEEVPAWQDTHGRDSVEPSIECRRALRAVAELPVPQRQYLTLLISGHSYREIADATGATHTNVAKHLKRARTTLRANS